MTLILWLLIGVGVLVWLFLGYWSNAAIARYFVNRYSQTLGSQAWNAGNKISAIFFMLFGPVFLLAEIPTLNAWGELGNLKNPLWTWPFWTYRE